jgi:hypothetical protein
MDEANGRFVLNSLPLSKRRALATLNAAMRELVDLAVITIDSSRRDVRRKNLSLTDKGTSFFRMLSQRTRDLCSGAWASSMAFGYDACSEAATTSENPQNQSPRSHE